MKSNQKIVLITGANRGIGYETARQLKQKGLRVILSARNADKGLLAARELETEFLQMDIADEKSISSAANEFKQRFGNTLDILINNAGIFPDEKESIQTVSQKLILEAFVTNTVGPMLTTQYFEPLLKNTTHGARIINLSSKMGQLSSMTSVAPAYSMSKTTLNALTCQQSAILSNKNIAVNSVSPGWVRTEMGGPDADLSAEQGADSIVWLALDAPQSLTGKFIRDREQIEW